MAEPCPWCGVAPFRERFDECLALDWSDGRYGAVHHRTAHTHALQHRTQADAFEGVVARFLRKHLDRPPPAEAMAALGTAAGGATRVAPPGRGPGSRRVRARDLELPEPAAATRLGLLATRPA